MMQRSLPLRSQQIPFSSLPTGAVAPPLSRIAALAFRIGDRFNLAIAALQPLNMPLAQIALQPLSLTVDHRRH